MTAYVLRRLWQMVPILLAVALLIFFIFSIVPGTFASSTAADGRNVVDAQVLERMNAEISGNLGASELKASEQALKDAQEEHEEELLGEDASEKVYAMLGEIEAAAGVESVKDFTRRAK